MQCTTKPFRYNMFKPFRFKLRVRYVDHQTYVSSPKPLTSKYIAYQNLLSLQRLSQFCLFKKELLLQETSHSSNITSMLSRAVVWLSSWNNLTRQFRWGFWVSSWEFSDLWFPWLYHKQRWAKGRIDRSSDTDSIFRFYRTIQSVDVKFRFLYRPIVFVRFEFRFFDRPILFLGLKYWLLYRAIVSASFK
jgi:hypothetical protein